MPGANPLYYWDTCLFLAWLKDETRISGEMAGVREVIERSKRRDCRLMTSVLTSVEVLQGKIPAGFDTLFAGLLRRMNRIGIDTKIAGIAHDIRNHYETASGSKLKTPDAIHLATAIIHRADEFHTFDKPLISLTGNVAGHNLIICKPTAKNPELDLPPQKKVVAGKDSFESVAKRLKCDEDKERFERSLGKIAKPKQPKK